MRRRFSYALTAGVLSSSAPAGLLGIRLARATPYPVSLNRVRTEIALDCAAYFYVGAATAAIFAVFGYVLGRRADQLAELSETDSLTGLYNARGFHARLRAEIRRSHRYDTPLSVLFLDLDGLKAVNDREGHPAGSDALRQVARIISAELRTSDVAARWGGDEFTILAPNIGSEAALILADRIRQRIAAKALPCALTASIGVATANGEDFTTKARRSEELRAQKSEELTMKTRRLEESTAKPRRLETTAEGSWSEVIQLMRAADAAMYEAKRRGKNTVVLAPDEALMPLVEEDGADWTPEPDEPSAYPAS